MWSGALSGVNVYAAGFGSVVAGGSYNNASGHYTVVAGGQTNTAMGVTAVIGGGS